MKNDRGTFILYINILWLYILTQKFILSAKVQNHYDELKF